MRKLDRKYSSSATALKSRATALLELSPKLIELCLLSFARFQATWFAEWMAHVPRIFNVEHQHKFVSESKLCRVPDVGEIVEAYNRNPPPQALTLFGEPSPTREPVSRGPDVQVHEAAEPAKKEAAIEYFPQYSLVASLFQFSNSRDVYEDGYPWLSYEPGEVVATTTDPPQRFSSLTTTAPCRFSSSLAERATTGWRASTPTPRAAPHLRAGSGRSTLPGWWTLSCEPGDDDTLRQIDGSR